MNRVMNKINSYISGYKHGYEQFQQDIIIIYISGYIENYKYYNNGVTPKGVGLSGSNICCAYSPSIPNAAEHGIVRLPYNIQDSGRQKK